MVLHKDVVMAVLSASATLAGLALVFLGIVFSLAQSTTNTLQYPPWVGWTVFAPFIFGIICIGESTAWLLTRNNESLYVATLVTFWMQLALLLVASLLMTLASSVSIEHPDKAE